jgi:hypothetical protein
MQIYLARNNQQAGPYSLDQLNQMLSSQQVLLTDLVWHEGMSEWKTLGELTQGKLVYEPVGYSSFNHQINNQTEQSTFKIKVEQKTSELASFHSRALAKVIDLTLWLPMAAIPSFSLTKASTQNYLKFKSNYKQAKSLQVKQLSCSINLCSLFQMKHG